MRRRRRFRGGTHRLSRGRKWKTLQEMCSREFDAKFLQKKTMSCFNCPFFKNAFMVVVTFHQSKIKMVRNPLTKGGLALREKGSLFCSVNHELQSSPAVI